MTKSDAQAKLDEAQGFLDRAQAAMAQAIQQVTHWRGYVQALTDAEMKPADIALLKGRKRGK